VEQGIREQGERLAEESETPADGGARAGDIEVGARVRLGTGSTGDVLEIRSDGKVVVAMGSMRVVAEAADLTPLPRASKRRTVESTQHVTPGDEAAGSLEIDLRGMTGDEAEQATVA